ncbi:hypothetical protein [Polaromonas sp. CG9_12]|nr:hypothetical protein [Polaromonas sp. CG9_12]
MRLCFPFAMDSCRIARHGMRQEQIANGKVFMCPACGFDEAV